MQRNAALIFVAAMALGCKPPPEAPAAFSDLCGWVHEHAWDEDPAALEVGVADLAAWLDTEWDSEESEDGFIVTSLTAEAMDGLDTVDRSNTDMVGLALPTESINPVVQSTWALVAIDQSIIFPDSFSDYERTYHSGPDCFLDRSCTRMEAEENMTSTFGMGVSSTAHSWNQYIWVEMEGEDQWAMVHRNWQMEPPEVNLGWMRVTEQTYLNVFIPRPEGAWRLQAQWTVYDPDNDVPEDIAKNLVINFFQSTHDGLEEYLEENQMP